MNIFLPFNTIPCCAPGGFMVIPEKSILFEVVLPGR